MEDKGIIGVRSKDYVRNSMVRRTVHSVMETP